MEGSRETVTLVRITTLNPRGGMTAVHTAAALVVINRIADNRRCLLMFSLKCSAEFALAHKRPGGNYLFNDTISIRG